MELEQLLETCPEYAKDLKLNMGSVLRQTELTERQTWGTAVCSAMASRNRRVLEAVQAEASRHLDGPAMFAARAAAYLALQRGRAALDFLLDLRPEVVDRFTALGGRL